MIERLMMLSVCPGRRPLPSRGRRIGVAGIRRRGVRAARAAALRRRDDRDVRVLQRGLLETLELDLRAPIREDRRELVVLRGGQVALGLYDEVVRRHADLELALLGLEL